MVQWYKQFAQSLIAAPPPDNDEEEDLSFKGALVCFHDDLVLLVTGYVTFFDGDGEVGFSLLCRGLDSCANLAAEDDDDSFLSFVLSFLFSSRILSLSAPSFFCFSLFCAIAVRSA